MDVQKVWEEYGAHLKGFLVSRVSTPEDAEDLLQDILVKTHKSLSSIKDPAKFKSWLYQIARNTLIDYYRKKRPDISIHDIPELESFTRENPEKVHPVFSDMRKCIKPFLLRLPEKYRDAIEATDLNGISQKAYAEKLGVSHSTIKSRVQRGRAMLSDFFHECCSYQLDARGNIMDCKEGEDCC